MRNRRLHRGRSAGFTLVELMAAILLLSSVLVIVAQTAYTSMRERGRASARQAALETANNFLEAARALPWSELTSTWAADQTLPESAALPEGSKLTVHVEDDKLAPAVKRVRVEVRIAEQPGRPETAFELVGLFADRSAGRAAGGAAPTKGGER